MAGDQTGAEDLGDHIIAASPLGDLKPRSLFKAELFKACGIVDEEDHPMRIPANDAVLSEIKDAGAGAVSEEDNASNGEAGLDIEKFLDRSLWWWSEELHGIASWEAASGLELPLGSTPVDIAHPHDPDLQIISRVDAVLGAEEYVAFDGKEGIAKKFVIHQGLAANCCKGDEAQGESNFGGLGHKFIVADEG